MLEGNSIVVTRSDEVFLKGFSGNKVLYARGSMIARFSHFVCIVLEIKTDFT